VSLSLQLRSRHGAAPTPPAAVRVVSPASRDVWQTALAADPDALPSQTPRWLDWVCAVRGHSDASRLYDFGGRVVVLPMAARRVAGVPVVEESMPYGLGYGGAVAAGGPVSVSEARTILADLEGRPAARVSITPPAHVADVWRQAAPARAHRIPFLAQSIDLGGGFATVWAQRYRKNTRTKVRRAEKMQLDVRSWDGADIVQVFDDLNRQSVDRWARQRGQSLWLARAVERHRDRTRQLRTAPAALGDMYCGWTAHWQGEAVAAYVMLRFGSQAVFWMSAMNRELADRTRAGYLLQSLAIEEACTGGAIRYHLGESEPGSGVQRFKAAFGAEPHSYEALRFERVPLTAAEHAVRGLVARLRGTGVERV
jgi:Acetyltransferase (GNAT) domain